MAQGLGSGFTSAEILAMQKDAVRRVNEMQRLAQEKLKNSSVDDKMKNADSDSIDTIGTHKNKSKPPNITPPDQHVHQSNQHTSSDNVNNSDTNRHQQHQHNVDDNNSSTGDTILTYHDDSGNIHTPQDNQLPDYYPKNTPATGFAGILQQLNLDDEKIIIILLLILLVNEGADTMMILALVYILL